MGQVAKLDFTSAFAQLGDVASSLSVSVYEAMGTMTAVVSAPGLILPSDWLPALLREDGLADADDGQVAVHSIMSIYNAIVTDLNGGRLEQGDFETFEQVCQWCVGYAGIAMLDATWASDSEALAHIKPIRLLAALDEEGRASIEQVKAAMEDFDTVDAAAATALKCAVEVDEYWGAARRGLAPRAAESGPEPFRREQPKVSRNQPCPCGSGKKYKRCCGVN